MLDEVINVDRIKRRLDELGEIGKTTEGGVTCLAYSQEENNAFEYIMNEIPDNYSISTDTVGNLFATPDPGANNSVYLGSHMDSVRNGGTLDGKLGVVTALESIQSIDRSEAEPPLTPTLVVFRAEETARFNVGLIGSRSAVGLLTEEQLTAEDESGTSLRDAMQTAGFQPPEIGTPTLDLDRVQGFIELHIEQGPILDSRKIPIGIVNRIRGPLRDKVTVVGRYNHSGATPMDQRKDALAGAAEIVLAVEDVGKEAAKSGDMVTTVGDMQVPNASANKISGRVQFPIDYRSTDSDYRGRIVNKIRAQMNEIAVTRGLEVNIHRMERIDPVELQPEIVDLLADSAEKSGTDFQRMPSGGGHDVMSFSKVGIPAGLVFTSCKNGLSHNPNEATSVKAMKHGTKTLTTAILEYGVDGENP